MLQETLLATTQMEFQQNNVGFKLVRLWDSIYPSPPTVTRFLVAPFNKNGRYEGEIDSIRIEYTCTDESKCSIVTCDPKDNFTTCLKNKFKYNAAKSWCDRTQMQGCDKLRP